MSISARQLGRLLRLPALALLLVAVLVNPVLAAIGDLHEASRGNGVSHAVEEHVAAGEPSHDQNDPAGDLLHALMHGAHCCGHLTALTSSFALVAALPARADAPRTAHPQRASVRLSTMIRPPIAI